MYVGKYTVRPMDPMGFTKSVPIEEIHNILFLRGSCLHAKLERIFFSIILILVRSGK